MRASSLLASLLACLLALPASAATYDITIDGSDSIFLAGRTDLTIPPANAPWGDADPATYDGMLRHAFPTPEEILETLPPIISVSDGDVVKVADPAVGGISFFNGFGAPFYGPEGNPGVSNLSPFAGISGYIGTQGALVGVFLTDAIPNGTPPPSLNFSAGGIGTDFTSIVPDIGQIFFIGDGMTSGGEFQEFIAPTGATRLAFGIPDGFSFVGVPGAYDDNDGAYRIRVGVNQTPIIPLPAGAWLLISGLGILSVTRRRRGH